MTPSEFAERDTMLAEAQRSLAASAPLAQADPHRPAYHFTAPANWINDPNGTVFHRGWYHLFYQHHPHNDGWDSMHWGHARSRDLVNWEHLPVALWPSVSRGEDHCFSGCAVIDDADRPIALYTSIGKKRDPEVWAAIGDAELIRWEKHPANPIITLAAHGGLAIDDWRDPCVFREGPWWYMVVGGHVRGGTGAVFLYRSPNLLQWTFLGIPLGGPQFNWECPNLFRLGDRWVFFCSPHEPPRYWVGHLDIGACRFVPNAQGVLDAGVCYAPTTLADPAGRRVMLGWGLQFIPGRAWNGYMTLPRVLGLDADGHLTQSPVVEVESLRASHRAMGPLDLDAGATTRCDGIAGDMLELEIDLELAAPSPTSAGLRVLASSDGTRGVDIALLGDELRVGGRSAKAHVDRNRRRETLRAFVDRSVIEVYADGFPCVTHDVRSISRNDTHVFLQAAGPARVHRLDAWQLRRATIA